MSPRLPPVDVGQLDDVQRETWEWLGADPMPHVLGTALHSPHLTRASAALGLHFLRTSAISARDRELITLRVAHLCASDYELAHHRRLAERAGVTEGELQRVALGPAARGWSDRDRALLRAVDQLVQDHEIESDTWRALSSELGAAVLVDLCHLVGYYAMLAGFLRSAGVEIEPWAQPAPAAPASISRRHDMPATFDRHVGAVAVVVGAGQTEGQMLGNGRATALLFAAEGADVVAVDRDAASVQETARMIRELGREVEVVVGDVASTATTGDLVDVALDRFGRIDVLLNNVGVSLGDGEPHLIDDRHWLKTVDVNLHAAWRICKRVVPQMRSQQHGVILNMSSIAAVLNGGRAAYAVSKAAMNELTRLLAASNAAHGIRANALLLGAIDTPLAVDAAARLLNRPRAEVAAARAAMVPAGRQGTAWEVASAAVFLASDAASFINGAIIPVDGGQLAAAR